MVEAAPLAESAERGTRCIVCRKEGTSHGCKNPLCAAVFHNLCMPHRNEDVERWEAEQRGEPMNQEKYDFLIGSGGWCSDCVDQAYLAALPSRGSSFSSSSASSAPAPLSAPPPARRAQHTPRLRRPSATSADSSATMQVVVDLTVEEKRGGEGAVPAGPTQRQQQQRVPRRGQKLQGYTLERKIAVLDRARTFNLKPSDVEQREGIPAQTVRRWMRGEDALRATFKGHAGQASSKRIRNARVLLDPLDVPIMRYMESMRREKLPITNDGIRAIALLVKNELLKNARADNRKALQDFKASAKWVRGFRRRHNITERRTVYGEAGNYPDKHFAEPMSALRAQLVGVDPRRIFNMDETGLFFAAMPKRTFILEGEKERDVVAMANAFKPKNRVTMVLCMNASGTIRCPVFLIGTAETPHIFSRRAQARNFTRSVMPNNVVYTNQSNAWMDGERFRRWWQGVFIPVVKREFPNGEQVFLLMDNCSSHDLSDDLKDDQVKVLPLPPNSTSLHQPMDCGIIECFKRRYRRALLEEMAKMSVVANQMRKLVERHKITPGCAGTQYAHKPHMGDVAHFVGKVWKEMDNSIAVNCFAKSEAIPASTVKALAQWVNDEGDENALEEFVATLPTKQAATVAATAVAPPTEHDSVAADATEPASEASSSSSEGAGGRAPDPPGASEQDAAPLPGAATVELGECVRILNQRIEDHHRQERQAFVAEALTALQKVHKAAETGVEEEKQVVGECAKELAQTAACDKDVQEDILNAWLDVETTCREMGEDIAQHLALECAAANDEGHDEHDRDEGADEHGDPSAGDSDAADSAFEQEADEEGQGDDDVADVEGSGLWTGSSLSAASSLHDIANHFHGLASLLKKRAREEEAAALQAAENGGDQSTSAEVPEGAACSSVAAAKVRDTVERMVHHLSLAEGLCDQLANQRKKQKQAQPPLTSFFRRR